MRELHPPPTDFDLLNQTKGIAISTQTRPWDVITLQMKSEIWIQLYVWAAAKVHEENGRKQNFAKDSIALVYTIWPFSSAPSGSPLIRDRSGRMAPAPMPVGIILFHSHHAAIRGQGKK